MPVAFGLSNGNAIRKLGLIKHSGKLEGYTISVLTLELLPHLTFTKTVSHCEADHSSPRGKHRNAGIILGL